jgi:hypothetical protein
MDYNICSPVENPTKVSPHFGASAKQSEGRRIGLALKGRRPERKKRARNISVNCAPGLKAEQLHQAKA